MSLRQVAVAQFRKPQGALGHLAGLVMAARPSNRARNNWTVDLLGIQPEDRVLEIGCGPGLALASAAARASRGSVTGIDHSPVMIRQAAARNAGALAEGRISLIVGGFDRLAGITASFDKIYSVNVVQFLADRKSAFAALYALLAPGGLLATTYMPRTRAATRADALRMAEECVHHMEVAGFDAIRIEELPLRPVPAVSILGTRPAP